MRQLFILIFFCFHLATCFADVASDTVYLTYMNDPSTTMTIQWLSEPLKKGSGIDYKNIKSDVWYHQEGVFSSFPSEDNEFLLHHVELANLEPSEEYEFKISGSDTKRKFLFKTIPNDLSKPLHFIVGGDMYHEKTTDLMQKTCIQAALANPDFVVIGGDIAYAVKTSRSKENMTRWIDWIRTWNQCMITPSNRLIPVIAAIGNHDLEGHFNQTPKNARVFSKLFPRANNSIYETLDFGSYLTLFILDSGHANPVAGAQAEWLNTEMLKRKDIPHRFAVYHVPAYPSVRAYTTELCNTIRHNWVPIFDKNGMHLVFEHHDHAYKRTHPLRNNKINPEGIVYMGDGAWSVDKARSKLLSIKPPYLAHFAASRHFISVTIHQSGLRHIRSISDEGKLLDEYKQYPQIKIKQEVPLQKEKVA